MKSSPFLVVTQHGLVVIDVSGQPIGSIFKGQAVPRTHVRSFLKNLKRRYRLGGLSNIKMEGTELRCDSVDGIDVTQDRGRWQTVVDAIWNIQVPQT
jgi:Asp-tRNA(Asn)/Glu-tRNA(Gln) amidotransferase B subunit